MDSIIAVSFGNDSKAYDGLTKLKELDGQRQIDLAAAAVVVRREDGRSTRRMRWAMTASPARPPAESSA
jgi:uncharacterized membrane protein